MNSSDGFDCLTAPSLSHVSRDTLLVHVTKCLMIWVRIALMYVWTFHRRRWMLTLHARCPITLVMY
jgi:hypothetical protein